MRFRRIRAERLRYRRGATDVEEESPWDEATPSSRDERRAVPSDGASSWSHDSGSPVPAQVRALVEPSFGHNFGDVRVHHDEVDDRSARAMGASAFAMGDDLYFARDAYDPHSPGGVHLLAHELAHTVQQEGGASSDVAPDPYTSVAAESEAREAADTALAGGSASPGAALCAAPVVQYQDEASKETEAQKAQRIVGQFPWMRAMFPQWAVTAGAGGLTATKSDGTTMVQRTADVGFKDGFNASVGQRRVTETDKDHNMVSEHKAGYADGMGYVETMSGGKSLAADGTKVADEKRTRMSAGADGAAVTQSTSATRDTVTTTTSKGASLKDGELSGSYERGREFKLDDDNAMGSKTGVKVGTSGGSFSRESSSRIKDVETGAVQGEKSTTGLGYDKDKGLTASYGREKSTEVGNETFSKGTNVSFSGGNVELTRTSAHSTKDDAGESKGNSTTTGFKAGADGLGVSRTNTDASGNKTSMSMGGDMKFGKDGMPTAISMDAGFSRNGKSVSVKGGYEVTASDPRPVGKQFAVDWERKLSAGAKGGAKGVGANAGMTDSQFGTKMFATKEEAQRFKDNAASMLPSASNDPTSVQGAMHLDIGESRGTGESSTLGGSLSVSPTAGNIGVGASKTDSESTSVKRSDVTTFEITKEVADASSQSVTMGTLGVGATGHREQDSKSIVTVRVDTSTDAGKAAFEAFSKSGLILPGAKVISTRQIKGEGSGTTVDLGVAAHDRSGRVEEELSYDEQGNKIERYSGMATESFAGKYDFIKTKFDQQVRFDAREVNDQQRYYSIGGTAFASDGKKSAEQLSELTNTEVRDATNAKSSGRWGVEVEVTQKMVEDFMAKMEAGKVRQEGIFEGDPRNALRARLQEATSHDDKMRAMASFFREFGHDGKAIRAMTDTLYGVADQWQFSVDYETRKANKLGNFNYDLTLEGDRNFRGSAARLELEAKIKDYQAAIATNPGAAGTLHSGLRELLLETRRQRSEVGDPKRYTDMPDELREMQVARLDGYISTLEGMTERAGISAVERDAAGLVAGDASNTQGTPTDGSAGTSGDPDTDALNLVRKEVLEVDRSLQIAKSTYESAVNGYSEHFKTVLKLYKGDLPETAREAYRLERDAISLKGSIEPMESPLTELRSQYVEALSRPAAARAAGGVLLTHLKSVEATWTRVSEKMADAEAKIFGMVP